MQQQIKKPAGRPVFGEGCGDGSFPQKNHEAFSHKCQQNSEPVDLLKEHYFRHAEIMSHRWREIVQIEFLLAHHVAQKEQLEAQLEDARSEYEEEQAEMTRLQRLAHGGGDA